MKKSLLICLAVMLMVGVIVNIGIGQDFDPVEPIERAVILEGGTFELENSPEIKPGVFYHLLGGAYEDLVGGYRKINLQETGTYHIYIRNNSKDNFSVKFLDKYAKDELKHFEDHGYAPIISSIDLKSGTYYFGKDTTYFPKWFKSEGFLAMCAPSLHAGDLSEEVIVKEPTCTEPGYKAQYCLLCGSEVNQIEIPALGHTPGETVVIEEPTCTEPGRKATLCAVCGAELESELIPPHDHIPGEEEILSEPTCLTEGVKEIKCQECGQTLSRETSPLTDHKPGQFIQVLAPTCTTAGRNEQHCEICNALLDTEEVESYGHVPGPWEDLLSVTAETDGLRVQRCVVCGETLNSEVIKAPNSK